MEKEVYLNPKKYVCDIYGDIYNVEFKKSSDFDIATYTSFIEDIKNTNIDLFLKSISTINVSDLISYFNTLDVNALNLLYCKCISLDTDNSHNICDLILNYFESFVECKKKMFCSKKRS